MKIKTALIAALAGVFAVTAAAPSFAAKDPIKKEKRINRMIKRADLNGDGKISQSELSRGRSSAFTTIQRRSPGRSVSQAKAWFTSANEVTSLPE